MKTGDKVKVIQPVIEGPITDTQYNKDAQCLEHLIVWDFEGETHQRWFLENQLQQVAD